MREILYIAITGVFGISAGAQGTFQNLDFESSDLSPVPSGQYGPEVSIASALPGWSGLVGGVPVTEVLQNNQTLGAAGIDIIGPNWNYVDPGVLSGNYSVFLQSNPLYGTSIVQDGTLPANAQWLELEASDVLGTGPPLVSFGGNNLPLMILSTGTAPSGQPYNVYGANVSAWAGQNGLLSIGLSTSSPYWVELDNITFSTQTIPEPNIIVLAAIGSLVFAAQRRVVHSTGTVG